MRNLDRFDLSPARLVAATAMVLFAANGSRCLADSPAVHVTVQLLEGISSDATWDSLAQGTVTREYDEDAFGFVEVPRKYSEAGLIVDRSNPFALRATASVKLPVGKHRLLLRSFNAARLFVDGELIAETRFLKGNADGHEAVPDLPQAAHPDLRPLPVGHAETVGVFESDGAEHQYRLEAIVGGKKLRCEIGELFVAVARAGPDVSKPADIFRLLSPRSPLLALDDQSWETYAEGARRRNLERSRSARKAATLREDEYWQRRHELARRRLQEGPPVVVPRVASDSLNHAVWNEIDHFIVERLDESAVQPTPLTDDWTFLRRVSLDTRGIIPSYEEIESFLRDSDRDGRRKKFIDAMLESPRWADHWVAYWQDVLAENPGILKPKLNNTGPFRWWIHESFSDNKPMDRFVTELVRMEGSLYGGAPAGFAVATENDVPMAAKAHILGTAFLGVEMKCARCHDAPHHPFKQKDLFSLAAMLKREPQEVPKTSSIPGSPEEREDLRVEVTLEPGSRVAPSWPFVDLAEDLVANELSDELLRDKGDTRERLALILTHPDNSRFAEVVVNRVWKRYMGYGLVEPVDDWDGAVASHPELLRFLARELVEHGYDLKHVARLMLNSHTYQRSVVGSDANVPAPEKRLFTGPARRRLLAEQLVDSLFALTGLPIGSEELNLDVDGRRPVTSFLNLGTPRRAWEFVSLSNERDRPALAMPAAQSVVNLLKAFGWRESRQSPITIREDVATVLQPLILANGVVGQRATTLSDGNALTALCLEPMSLADLIRAVYLRILTRPPTEEEAATFHNLLSDGFCNRLTDLAAGREDANSSRSRSKSRSRNGVSWSNHLSAEASRIKLELERSVREGDPPTSRLESSWRERMEDSVWALINSPEFLFVP